MSPGPFSTPDSAEAPGEGVSPAGRERTAVQRRHSLLLDLLRVARRQRDALVAERFEDFLDDMAVRELIFEQLAGTEAPAPDNVLTFPDNSAAATDELRRLIPPIVAEVLQQDEENAALLRTRMIELRRALAAISRGFEAGRGYAGAGRLAPLRAALDFSR